MFKLIKVVAVAMFMMPVLMTIENLSIGVDAQAQEQQAKKKKKKVRVQSILQKNVKKFEAINAAFDEDKVGEAQRLLSQLAADETLNNIERAYVANYQGNIYFNQDNLNGALREFKKVVAIKEGVPESFTNQILYVIAQVYFSQENYSEALSYAQRWFRSQEDPPADAYMLIGQAQYMLKRYDDALPNVQKGIQKYIDLGSVPKEGWLNLLSSIYRQKEDFRAMLPVLKQLVQHYPKKTYLLTMGGVFNELDEPASMTAMYQAMYDQNLLTQESELVTLASLLMSQDSPYQASQVMGKGLETGVVKKNLKNYRIYSQALYLAKEYEKALAPLSQAARLDKNGKLYNQLGQSYIALGRWKDADKALASAVSKGGLQSTGQVLISQGLVRFEMKNYKGAKAAFNKALKYDKVASSASNWIKYVDAEVYRIAELNKEIVINTDVDV